MQNEKAVINYISAINEPNIQQLISSIESLKNNISQLTINISSIGGSLSAGVAAYNYLKLLPFPVTTHNIGEVSSSALLLYLAGSIRTSEHAAKFMLHPVAIHVNDDINFWKAKELMDSITADIKIYSAIVDKETNSLNCQYNSECSLKTESLLFNKDSAFKCGIVTKM